MNPNKASLLVPILFIILGVGWLLTAIDVAPGIDWVWTLGLAGAGLLTMALGGLDKVTVVVGPFFIVASFLSVLRQSGRMSVDIEVPVLTILAGVLLLVARAEPIPVPKWAAEEKGPGGDPLR